MSTEKEICICAAIKTMEGQIIRGHRHADCIRTAILMRLKVDLDSPEGSQGFITSQNRFVLRKEAKQLQDEAGIESAAGGYRGDILFSEDLY